MSGSETLHIELDEEAVQLLNLLKSSYASSLLSQAVDAAVSRPCKITASDIRRVAAVDEATGGSANEASTSALDHDGPPPKEGLLSILRMLVIVGFAILAGSGVTLGAVLIPSVVHDNTSRVLIGVAMLGIAGALTGSAGLIAARQGTRTKNVSVITLATRPHTFQEPNFSAATDNLRIATRWLLTTAAITAAAMVVILPLTGIGSLRTNDWPRLIAAAVGLIAAFGAVGYVIFCSSRPLAHEWITLADIVESASFDERLYSSRRRRYKKRAETIHDIYGYLLVYREELYGGVAESISDLHRRLREANDITRESSSLTQGQTADTVRAAVDTIVQAANYFYIRAEFATLRRRLLQAGAVFVTGAVIFAYVAY